MIWAAEYSVALFISKKVDASQEIIVGILCGNYVGFNNKIVTEYFISKGVVAGFEEIMKIGIDKSATLRVVDLQTKEKAKAEFDANYNLNANYRESAGSFPQTKAFVTPKIDKYTGYTYFDNYFIMIHLLGSGYTTNDENAKNAAVLFIEKFNSKFDSL